MLVLEESLAASATVMINLNLVNRSIALANESTPLLLSNFSHLEDQTLSISW